MAFADINGHIIHYKWINQNKEKTFMFLNSLGTDFRIWDDVVPVFSEIGNVLLSDKRGHGLSDVVDDTDSIQDFAEDVVELLDDLEIENVIMIGLSVGGMIAMELTQMIPEKIQKLVLCDTRHQIGNDDGWDQRIWIVRQKGMEAISSDVMKVWFSNDFRKSQKEMVRGYQNMLERVSAQGYIRTCEAIRDADFTEVCKRISVPTLCLTGSDDPSTPPDKVKDLTDLIRNSRFEIIEGSAHIPCIENPDVFTQLVKEFILED